MNLKIIKSLPTMAIVLISLIILFIISFLIGRYPLSPSEVLIALVTGLFHIKTNLSPTIYTVVWDIRMPRIAAAMIVGAALSISGASFQGIFRNPLVSPDILGVSAGAGFGAALAILIGSSPIVIQIMAFLTGLVAVSLTYFLSKSFKGNATLIMVLGGIAIGALFSALTSCIKYVADPYSKLPEIIFWLMGSLATINRQNVVMIIIPIIIGFSVLLMIRWRINLLSMGDEEARTLGVDTERLRIIVILCCTLLTAAAVSISGIIGWVGLVIPHIARIFIGPDHKELIPFSIILGAVFLLSVDDICRTVAPVEIPLGIVTAIIGAPFFIYLLKRGYEGWT
nr:iron ABC transporter permease [uncultured Methanobacterium sp.]